MPETTPEQLIENLAIRIGNNLAFHINDKIEELVRFTHDLHPLTEGEKKCRKEQRLGELYALCCDKVLKEFDNPGTPREAILSEMDDQE